MVWRNQGIEQTMSLKSELIEITTRFCARTGMSKARLATIVVNDGKFFDRFEKPDGGCTIATFEKFKAYCEQNMPTEAA